MVNLKKIFKKHLESSKQIVEGQLEVSLGKIKILPYWVFGLTEFNYDNDFSLSENIGFFIEDATDFFIDGLIRDKNLLAKAGNKGIYYNSNRFTNKISENEVRKTLFHELYHIGLSKYGGYEDIYCEEFEMKVSYLLDELFAEYMAINTLEKENIIIKSKTLSNEIELFSLELSKEKIEKPKEIADFVLNYEKNNLYI